jgi:hypothetical protein
MTGHQPKTSLVSKLTLGVLVLILGCLLVLVYKAFQDPPPPLEQTASAEITVPLPEPAAARVEVTPLVEPKPKPVPVTSRRPAVGPAVTESTAHSDNEGAPSGVAPPTDVPRVPAVATAVDQPPSGIAVSLPPLRFEATPAGNMMILEGDSSAHKWSCVSRIISGYFQVEQAWQNDRSLASVTCLGPGKTPPACEIRIPVRALKSQVTVGASIMDSRMQAEMKARQFPYIVYRLTEMTIKGDVPASGTPVTFDTTGLLTVSGVTNKVSFPITMKRLGTDSLYFGGHYETKMTALGIRPPEFSVLGVAMKSADPIKLSWSWVVTLPIETTAR